MSFETIFPYAHGVAAVTAAVADFNMSYFISAEIIVLLISACGYFCSFHINHFRTLNRRRAITVDRPLAALKAANLKANQSSSYSNNNSNMEIHANRLHTHELSDRFNNQAPQCINKMEMAML